MPIPRIFISFVHCKPKFKFRSLTGTSDTLHHQCAYHQTLMYYHATSYMMAHAISCKPRHVEINIRSAMRVLEITSGILMTSSSQYNSEGAIAEEMSETCVTVQASLFLMMAVSGQLQAQRKPDSATAHERWSWAYMSIISDLSLLYANGDASYIHNVVSIFLYVYQWVTHSLYMYNTI